MKRRLYLILPSLLLMIVLLVTPVLAATVVFDNFNRADGTLDSNWTNVQYTMEIANNAAQAEQEFEPSPPYGKWCAATYNGVTGTILEGDVAANIADAAFVGLMLNYEDIDNVLVVNIQDNGEAGTGFNSLWCYNGLFPNQSAPYLVEYFDNILTAHMKVELVGSDVIITLSGIVYEGGVGDVTRTYTWSGVPNTGGTGVGITGFKWDDTGAATIDNFMVSTVSTEDNLPPGWDNGNKTGWDDSMPPGLDKQDKTPSGFDQGEKVGWDATAN